MPSAPSANSPCLTSQHTTFGPEIQNPHPDTGRPAHILKPGAFEKTPDHHPATARRTEPASPIAADVGTASPPPPLAAASSRRRLLSPPLILPAAYSPRRLFSPPLILPVASPRSRRFPRRRFLAPPLRPPPSPQPLQPAGRAAEGLLQGPAARACCEGLL